VGGVCATAAPSGGAEEGGGGVSKNRARNRAKSRTKTKIKRGGRRSSWHPNLSKDSGKSVKAVAVDTGATSNNGRGGNLNVVKTTPPTQSPCTQHQVRGPV